MEGNLLLMIGKTTPIGSSYHVNTTTDVSDQDKHREEKSRQSKKDNTALPTADKENAKPETTSLAEESPLSRQIIDSEKVVELLSHKPSAKNSANPFLKQNKFPLSEAPKKVNRTL